MAAEQIMYQVDFPPTPTQPSPCSFSSLLSWWQSEAKSLQGLTSRVGLLFNMVDWSVLSRLQGSVRKGENCLQTTKQGNNMYLNILYTCCLCVHVQYVCNKYNQNMYTRSDVPIGVSACVYPFLHAFICFVSSFSVCFLCLSYTCEVHRFSPGWYCGSVAVK